jgi:hypothetical protein
MEDEHPLTHTCRKCEALIYYTPPEEKDKYLVPVAICPKCGVPIPELVQMRVVAVLLTETK